MGPAPPTSQNPLRRHRPSVRLVTPQTPKATHPSFNAFSVATRDPTRTIPRVLQWPYHSLNFGGLRTRHRHLPGLYVGELSPWKARQMQPDPSSEATCILGLCKPDSNKRASAQHNRLCLTIWLQPSVTRFPLCDATRGGCSV